MKNKTLRRIVREGWRIRFDTPCPRLKKTRGGKAHQRKWLRAMEWADAQFAKSQESK